MSNVYTTRRALFAKINSLCHASGIIGVDYYTDEHCSGFEDSKTIENPVFTTSLIANFNSKPETKTIAGWIESLCEDYCDASDRIGGDEESWSVNFAIRFGDLLSLDLTETVYVRNVENYSFSDDEMVEDALENLALAGSVA